MSSLISSLMDWVRQLVIFYIISNVFLELVPNREYIRHIRTFTGIMLIIITAGPLLSFFDKNYSIDSLLRSVENALKQQEAKLQLNLYDDSAYSSIISPYIDEIRNDIDRKAWEYALFVKSCNIDTGTDYGSSDFGTITAITVVLSKKYYEKNDNRIDNIKIEDISIEPVTTGADTANTDPLQSDGNMKERISSECDAIKNYIVVQYGVKESAVSVAMEQ